MFFNSGHSGYVPASSPQSGFPASNFVPASSLSGGANNPFAPAGFQSSSGPNPSHYSSAFMPSQSTCKSTGFGQGQSTQGGFGNAGNSSFSGNSGFPSMLTQGNPSSSGFQSSNAGSFNTGNPTCGMQGQSFTSAFPMGSSAQTASKGTAGIVYQAAEEKEGMGTRPVPLLHVSAMAAFISKSTEELRLEDYLYNRGQAKLPMPPAFGGGTSNTNPFQSQAGVEGFRAMGQSTLAQGQTGSSFAGGQNSFFVNQPAQAQNNHFPAFVNQAKPDPNPFQTSYGFGQTRLQSNAPTPPKNSLPTPSTAFPVQPSSQNQSQFPGNPQTSISQNPFGNGPVYGVVQSGQPMTSSYGISSVQSVPGLQFPMTQQVLPREPETHQMEGGFYPTGNRGNVMMAGSQDIRSESQKMVNAFQPQPAACNQSMSHFGYQMGGTAQDISSPFTQGFKDPLGLSWLFPNGVPEDLKVPWRPINLPYLSTTEQLLRSKQPVSSRIAEVAMSQHWRKSKENVKRKNKPIFDVPKAQDSDNFSVFAKRPFREVQFEIGIKEAGTSLSSGKPVNSMNGLMFTKRQNDESDRTSLQSGGRRKEETEIMRKNETLTEGSKVSENERKREFPDKRKPIAKENGSKAVPGIPPKLTKTGYYTVPTADQLRQMSSQDLRHVTDFTIGNEHGKMIFTGETNVEGLDLDHVVVIEPRAVVVYPESASFPVKPEVGQHLNKPATVHLYNCTPRRLVSLEEFERKIRKVCERNSSEFVSYDQLTGEWVFRVQHF